MGDEATSCTALVANRAAHLAPGPPMRASLRRCRYWQDAGYFPTAAWSLDEHQIHQESRRLCRLARRADREKDRHVNLCDPLADHHDFQAGGIRLMTPRSLIQPSETLERCLLPPNR